MAMLMPALVAALFVVLLHVAVTQDGDDSELLAEMDENLDGLLSAEELHAGVREKIGDNEEFDTHLLPALKDLFPQVDTDGDAMLNAKELARLMTLVHQDFHEQYAQARGQDIPGDDELVEEMDKDSDGLLSAEELHAGVREKIGDDQEFDAHFLPALEDLFPQVDKDGDGKLNAKEVERLMTLVAQDFEQQQARGQDL